MTAPETALKRRQVWHPLLWCGLATLLAYWPALFGEIVYDDQLILRQNAALRGGDFGALVGSPFFVAQIG